MEWPQDAERDYWRHQCLNSFWWFFKYGWGYDFNPKGAAGPRPWLYESTHKAACDWYQHHALEWLANRKKGLGQEKKLMVIVPRDWGKTTLFTQAGQAWLHLHDPDLATYTGAETAARGKEVLSGIKAVISGDDKYSRFAWLYGGQRHPSRMWKTDAIVTAARTNLTRRDASFGTWAVQTGMVGLHPDGCFFDDPNTYEKMASKLGWLKQVIRHLDSLIPVFQSDAIWVLTGTRYGDGDHLGSAIKKEGCKSITGMVPNKLKVKKDGTWDLFFMDAEDDDYPESDPRHYIMPKIWSPSRINSFKRRNPTRYYAQVRNDPTLSPYNTLTFDQCFKMIKPISPDELKKLRISIHVDTAFKREERKADGDYTAISFVGHMTDGSGRCVFLGAFASQNAEYESFGKELIARYKSWRERVQRITCLTDEDDVTGKPGIWENWLANLFRDARIPLPTIHIFKRQGTDKETRMRDAAGHWASGRMILMEGAENMDMLIEQMVKIGKSQYDDLADCTSDCFNRDIYQTVFLKHQDIRPDGSNPFDDVLKPGKAAVDAAEEIAKMWDQRHSESGNWDVVQPW